MRCPIRYLSDVLGDIRHLPPETKKQVLEALDSIAENPHAGIPLERELTGYWKYPAKRYRIIYKIISEKRQALVVLIDHRRSVYDRLREIIKGLE